MRRPDIDSPIPRLVTYGRTRLIGRDATVDLAHLNAGTCLGGTASRLEGSSVLVATRDQLSSALAFVELDGAVRRLVIAPPDLKPEHVGAMIEDAGIDAIVTDDPQRFADCEIETVVTVSRTIEPTAQGLERSSDTDWVLLTSGTAGRPKMVVHRLAALTGAIAGTSSPRRDTVWATFYDIRRYGGLQIFLRAVLGGTDLVLSSEGESIGDHLKRLGAAGVTSISGTPSHWRRVLMSNERNDMAPSYVRLSGEIADQIVLDGLRATYPAASIGHAYASTEAGVGFAVDDGREGFPAALLDSPRNGIEMKVVEGSLRIRSKRAATSYAGKDSQPLADADGFIDTGDLVERVGDRYLFVGRRGGIINVGGLKVNPEEVEAAINAHAQVRMSLVRARKNPLTGAIVVADVVLRDQDRASEDVKAEILAQCRARLDRHKVPAIVRFVPALELTAGGKLSRAVAG